jgi:hypothetical protein
MNLPERQLDRLLRAAAGAPQALPEETPFGFATRVLAAWRAQGKAELVVVSRLLRRVVLLSLGVMLLASAGVYHDLAQGNNFTEAAADEYAIADFAIGNVLDQ